MPSSYIKTTKFSSIYGFLGSFSIHLFLVFLLFFAHASFSKKISPSENFTKISLDSFTMPTPASVAPQIEVEEQKEIIEEVVEEKIVKKVVEETKPKKKKEKKIARKKQEAVFSKSTQNDTGLTEKPSKIGSSYANIASLISAIIAKEAKKNYPDSARKRRQTGIVKVSFLYDINQIVKEIKIVQSSGFDILDATVLKVINKTKHKFPKPEETATYVVPVKFSII